jgi:hypothetical protein
MVDLIVRGLIVDRTSLLRRLDSAECSQGFMSRFTIDEKRDRRATFLV